MGGHGNEQELSRIVQDAVGLPGGFGILIVLFFPIIFTGRKIARRGLRRAAFALSTLN
jgi:hypothetical protein